ncbi:MAG: biotin--[acetyl-CoA-carboxylase] ligase [Bacteroidetes bacterium]|nr:biotin--[acetyl-CoA-carboxylase] ligase [Bacteroidota bacterium]
MKTLFVGRTIIRLEKVGSTNNYAASLPVSDAPEGTVIIAENQTEGRGQGLRKWHVEPGKNITATVVFRPLFLPSADIFALNKAVALALMHACNEVCGSAKCCIKWPNDILSEGRKLAGILTENTMRGSQIVSYLAGFGLNVNQTEFPPEAGKPGSLRLILQSQELDKERVLQVICEHLEVWYLKLRNGKILEINEAYNANLWQDRVRVIPAGTEEGFYAQVNGVDLDGKLLLTDEQGCRMAIAHGEAIIE